MGRPHQGRGPKQVFPVMVPIPPVLLIAGALCVHLATQQIPTGVGAGTHSLTLTLMPRTGLAPHHPQVMARAWSPTRGVGRAKGQVTAAPRQT